MAVSASRGKAQPPKLLVEEILRVPSVVLGITCRMDSETSSQMGDYLLQPNQGNNKTQKAIDSEQVKENLSRKIRNPAPGSERANPVMDYVPHYFSVGEFLSSCPRCAVCEDQLG
ncbi:hypothetical protein ACJJTC_002097 [Scirpophaga incertulas]